MGKERFKSLAAPQHGRWRRRGSRQQETLRSHHRPNGSFIPMAARHHKICGGGRHGGQSNAMIHESEKRTLARDFRELPLRSSSDTLCSSAGVTKRGMDDQLLQRLAKIKGRCMAFEASPQKRITAVCGLRPNWLVRPSRSYFSA